MSKKALIAPCGMNCGICLGYLREKNRCEGCRFYCEGKPGFCKKCIIINCALLSQTESKFCYDCPKYPCRRLKQLDQRYRIKYHMSMIENLETIKNIGLDGFVEKENKRWICPACGAVRSVHRDFCLLCKTPFNV